MTRAITEAEYSSVRHSLYRNQVVWDSVDSLQGYILYSSEVTLLSVVYYTADW